MQLPCIGAIDTLAFVSHRIFYFSLNGLLSEVVILYCSKASSRVRSVGIFSTNVITDVNMNGMLLLEIKSDFSTRLASGNLLCMSK